MKTMKAVVFKGKDQIAVEEVPRPAPRAGEAVIRITTTTICGTDVHIVRGEYSVKPGLILGHEPVGVIEELGGHIGSGATSFARSKLSGTRQLLAVSFHTYSRPIPTPVQNLRPARDTCEQCHWPSKVYGDKVQRIVEYGVDEKNTESVTTLQLHVGGTGRAAGAASEIHWHADVANEVDYISPDDKRQVIPYVRVKDRTGSVREYVAEGVTPDQLAKGERRRMDCLDCHNRPSHQMAATAERAVNVAMARADIPPSRRSSVVRR